MEEKSKVPALKRCLDILDLLQKGPATIAEIVAKTNLARSSVYVLIDEMVKYKLIKQNKEGKYQLWVYLIALGQSAKQSFDVKDFIDPFLSVLVESIDCLAVHYGIMDGDKAYYLIKKTHSKSGLSIRSREGMEMSLVHAGIGKCLLAYQDDAIKERIISKLDYTPATETSITNEEDFRKELANIRLQGWAFDNSEGEREIRCVAAPVFNTEGKIMGAISVVGLNHVFTDYFVEKVVVKVKQCAQNITEQLK